MRQAVREKESALDNSLEKRRGARMKTGGSRQYMIRISQIKIPVTGKKADAEEKRKLTERAAGLLRTDPSSILSISIVRRSIDARK